MAGALEEESYAAVVAVGAGADVGSVLVGGRGRGAEGWVVEESEGAAGWAVGGVVPGCEPVRGDLFGGMAILMACVVFTTVLCG